MRCRVSILEANLGDGANHNNKSKVFFSLIFRYLIAKLQQITTNYNKLQQITINCNKLQHNLTIELFENLKTCQQLQLLSDWDSHDIS